MFKKSSNLFFLILALTMVVFLAACAPAATPQAEQPAATEALAEQPAATEAPTEAAATEAPAEAVATEAPAEAAAPAEKRVLKIWHYEQPDDAKGISWDAAMKEFEAKYPDVTIEFERKTFEQMQQTAQMVLNSEDVPDVLELNKGNAVAGLFSTQGLLTDLTDIASERGWDKILSPSIQTTCRYDEKGIMGSGKLYGVTTYGEFVLVYYNKDMFDQYGLEVPTSLEEFEAAADKFVAEGIQPLTMGALDIWPPMHDWQELMLYKADRDLISNYHLLAEDVDFQGEAFTFGATRLADFVKKGYFGENFNGTSYDDSNLAFSQGKVPMNLTGSWAFSGYKTGIKDFEWGVFLMPGKKFVTGSGGNLWVIPQNAKNKDLAADFIELTLGKNAQSAMANAGGLPINADISQVEDPKVKELNDLFATVVKNDGLAFYPDWPVPGFFDIMGSSLQQLLAGDITPEEFNEQLAGPYYEYKTSLE